jgi:hypothetical protein
VRYRTSRKEEKRILDVVYGVDHVSKTVAELLEVVMRETGITSVSRETLKRILDDFEVEYKRHSPRSNGHSAHDDIWIIASTLKEVCKVLKIGDQPELDVVIARNSRCT